jgi:hypothetical protein
VPAQTAEAQGEDEWLTTGHAFIGQRLRRSILTDDRKIVRTDVDGTVVGWLPAHMSNYFKDNDPNQPAALWRVQYDDAAVGQEVRQLKISGTKAGQTQISGTKVLEPPPSGSRAQRSRGCGQNVSRCGACCAFCRRQRRVDYAAKQSVGKQHVAHQYAAKQYAANQYAAKQATCQRACGRSARACTGCGWWGCSSTTRRTTRRWRS